MRVFFLLISFFILFKCAAAQFKSTNCDSIQNYAYKSVKYRTAVDVMGKHLSGIMIFKQMTDSQTRIVFLNEIGTTFFDLSFTNEGYKYNSILKSLDKRSVKALLAKDLGMLLIKGIYSGALEINESKFLYKLKKRGFVTYQVDEECKPIKIENISPKKKKIVAINLQEANNQFDIGKISIEHFTFSFQITMTLISDAEE